MKKVSARLAVALVFIIAGLLWLYSGIMFGPKLLTLPAALSLLSAALLYRRVGRRLRRVFIASTSLYNLILTAYHAYTSSTLFTLGLLTLASLYLAAYSILSLAFILITIAAYAGAGPFSE